MLGLVFTYAAVAVFRHGIEAKWGSANFAQTLMGLTGSFLSATLFVNFGAVLAPRKKYSVARTLALTYVCLTAAKFYDLWRWNAESHQVPWLHVAAAGCVGITAAFLNAVLYYQREQQFVKNRKKKYKIESF